MRPGGRIWSTWWRDMIYLVAGYDLPGGGIWSTCFSGKAPFCRKEPSWQNFPWDYDLPPLGMVEGYALPISKNLQKNRAFAKLWWKDMIYLPWGGGRIWSTSFFANYLHVLSFLPFFPFSAYLPLVLLLFFLSCSSSSSFSSCSSSLSYFSSSSLPSSASSAWKQKKEE